MKKTLKVAAAIAGLYAFSTHADVRLTYELNGPEMEPSSKTLSVSRFFARIEDPAKPESYLLYQAGKFFPLYRVEKAAGTYTRLTPEVKPTLHAGVTQKPGKTQKQPEAKETAAAGEQAATEPASTAVPADTAKQATSAPAEAVSAESTKAAPPAENTPAVEAGPAKGATPVAAAPAQPEPEKTAAKATAAAEQPAGEKAAASAGKPAEKKAKTSLRVTKKNKKIAGIPCRVVEELADGKPVMTHCMADKARLGITERETRTLARVFKMARERDYGWLGTTTQDEKFVSVASKDLRSNKTLELKAVSTKPLPVGYMRIERDLKQIPSK
ncbi:MAG: hypothetical protein ABFR65_02730 [Pseudomonadota bacterium]